MELKRLEIGLTLTLLELDNRMMENDYYTVFNGSLVEIIESENVVYTKRSPDLEQVIIEFKVLEEVEGNTGLTIVEILEISEF